MAPRIRRNMILSDISVTFLFHMKIKRRKVDPQSKNFHPGQRQTYIPLIHSPKSPIKKRQWRGNHLSETKPLKVSAIVLLLALLPVAQLGL